MPQPATFLPPHIQEVLKRKSTRDPSSRFPTKLHLLLSYTRDLPSYQEMVGVAWLNEEEFRMNKVTLAGAMGIKINTLNVNLQDLNFESIGRSKDGWSRWHRAGFTRSCNGLDPNDENLLLAQSVSFTIWGLTDEEQALFRSECQRLWVDILQCSPTARVSADQAVECAALRFRYADQPLGNAIAVLKAVFLPGADETHIVFVDFYRFMARFGPEPTVMLKLAPLLCCSNATGQWLTFGRSRAYAELPIAYFDDECANCLRICHGDGDIERVYQNPYLEAYKDSYLIDEHGTRYRDWQDWFDEHPVTQPLWFGRDKLP
jgi:hypothetical protein